MSFFADLHIHSRFSRATSRQCDLQHLAFWAQKKGIAVVGTGDFTHPAWLGELKDQLIAAEPGLFRLRPDLEREIAPLLPKACATQPTRFMLQVEISTIYKKATARGRSTTSSIPRTSRRSMRSSVGSGVSATSRPTAARSSGSTRATCWRSRSRAGQMPF